MLTRIILTAHTHLTVLTALTALTALTSLVVSKKCIKLGCRSPRGRHPFSKGHEMAWKCRKCIKIALEALCTFDFVKLAISGIGIKRGTPPLTDYFSRLRGQR